MIARRGPVRTWPEWLLLALSVEKIAQHAIVTWAFVVDLGNLRDEVAVDYRWLAATGAIAALLFLVAFVALLAERPWSLTLLTGLAVFDIVGESVAQATVIITGTVSFAVALVVFALSRLLATQHRRRADSVDTPGHR